MLCAKLKRIILLTHLRMRIYNTLILPQFNAQKDGGANMKSYYDEEGAPKLEDMQDTGKSSVLLVGDSIRQGYCATVKELLAKTADVYYPEDNCRFAQYIISSISSIVNLVPDPDRVKAVYWNCGHWDTAHFREDPEPLNSPEQYGHAVGRVQKAFKREFKNAEIIFATTTPMNPSGEQSINPRYTSEIKKYNDIAERIVLELGGKVDDLFELMINKDSSWYADYCHYTAEGFRYIGQHVAEFLSKELSKPNQ